MRPDSKTITAVVAVILLAAVAVPAPAQQCGPFVTGEGGLDGSFMLGVSYFSGIGIQNTGRLQDDLDDLAGFGLNNVRVWASWSYDPDAQRVVPGACVIKADGSLATQAMGRLKTLIRQAELRGMTVDVTFSYWMYVNHGCNGATPQSQQFTRYKNGIQAVAAALVDPAHPTWYRNAFFDLANEYYANSPALTNAQVQQLAAAVHVADPDRRVTASATGSPGTQANHYNQVLPAIDFVSPHFPRTTNPDWSAATAGRITSLRSGIGPRWPIHLQEEARRGFCILGDPNNNTFCRKSDFLESLRLAAQTGAAGWVFHTGAGYGLDEGSGSFYSRLDAVERDTIDELAGTLAASRCSISIADTFTGTPNGGDLEGRVTELGGAVWQTSTPTSVGFWNGAVTSRVATGAAVGGVPFLPEGQVPGQVMRVEARVSADGSEWTAIGFSRTTDGSFRTDGQLWLRTNGCLPYLLGPGESVLAEPPLLEIPCSTGFFDLALEYDPLARTVSAEYDGWQVFRDVPVPFAPDIHAAGLHIERGTETVTRVDDFVVTSTPATRAQKSKFRNF